MIRVRFEYGFLWWHNDHRGQTLVMNVYARKRKGAGTKGFGFPLESYVWLRGLVLWLEGMFSWGDLS